MAVFGSLPVVGGTAPAALWPVFPGSVTEPSFASAPLRHLETARGLPKDSGGKELEEVVAAGEVSAVRGVPAPHARTTARFALRLLIAGGGLGGAALVAARRSAGRRRDRSCRDKLGATRRAAGGMGAGPSSNSVYLGNVFDLAAGRGGVGVGGGVVGGPGGDGGQPQAGGTGSAAEARERVLKNIREFSFRPRDVKAYLDRYVVEQDEAKKVLAVALCDHYNWARRCLDDAALRAANYTKPNILILGPTGSGKTYLVRTLAKMLGVPFAKADATKFSETGIVGEDAEDVVRSLVDSAGGDAEVAQYGMVYIDEVDKIAGGGRGGGGSGGWSGKQVQSNFLKIMEDTDVPIKNSLQASLSGVLGGLPGGFGGGPPEAKSISTKFMLFIFSGAFNDLNELVKNRVGQQTMGFFLEGDDEGPASARPSASGGKEGAAPGGRSYLHLAETPDFVQAGLEPEFIGRVPVRVAIDALDSNDLFRILTEAEDSVLKQYENEFLGYNIRLSAEKPALQRVAELAVAEKTGARALVTVLERTLREFKFELPSTSCKELVLTEALLDNPAKVLGEMLSSPECVEGDIQFWLDELERRTKVRLDLADDVRQRILKECKEGKQSARSVLDLRFRQTGVVSGLQEIYEATDGKVERWPINMAMYEQPEEEIAKWKKGMPA